VSAESAPRPRLGYLYIGSAAFLWGISATLGRAAFTGHLLPGGTELRKIDPLILSQSRATLSLAVLLPVLLARRGASALRVPARDLVRFIVLGILGVAVSNYFYYVAIQRTNVATAIILQYTAPVWVLLYTAIRERERPSLRRTAAVALAVGGCALAVGLIGSGHFRMDVLGVSAALLAAFSFAFYNVGGHRVLVRYDRWKVLLWVLGLSAGTIFLLFCRPAILGTNPSDHSQLPRTSLQHSSDRTGVRRAGPPDANCRNSASTNRNRPYPATRTNNSR
jgi:drug/metabolite transporter, DME family